MKRNKASDSFALALQSGFAAKKEGNNQMADWPHAPSLPPHTTRGAERLPLFLVRHTDACYDLTGNIAENDHEPRDTDQGEDSFESELFPGLTIDLADLWPTDE